ncbi:MAG: DUF3795 domain-containing protein [Candidatus Hodarchaeota archaeon]
MSKKNEITTCGLSCDLCDANTTKTQDSAKYLLDIFRDPTFRGVISMASKDFNENNFHIFKKMLEDIEKFPPCPGCNGRKECPINQCGNKNQVEKCSQCEFLDVKAGICIGPIEPPKTPMMPPAPIFFNGLTKRYQNLNIKHLKALKEGKLEDVEKEIEDLIRKGKTNRDFIDFSINLFDSMKPSDKK